VIERKIVMKAQPLSLIGLVLSACCAWACASEDDQPSQMQPEPQAGAAAAPMTGGVGSSTAGTGSGGAAGTGVGGAAGTGVGGMGVGGTAGIAGGGTGGLPAAGTSAMMDPPEPPFGVDADVFEWSTGTFTLEASQERYLCFASTLEEDLVINGYHTDVEPFVHHLIFSRARDPEPEGFAECDIAFRNGWDPVFISGAGDTTLEFPDDAGHDLVTGTQMVVQMHLLNATENPVEGSLTIAMRRSTIANPRPVSTYIFGTAAVELPAKQQTQIIGTCPMWQPVHLIAGFPHMHMLGSAMTFEVGSEGSMQEVFKRDPFDFDNQRIDPLDVEIAAGDISRVSCTFTNDLDQAVGYGESTRNEMCYFIGFAIDRPSQSACLEVLPPSF